MTTFDTLTYAKKLQEAGFTEQQAEAQAEALRAVVEENLATKLDLKEMEGRLLHEIELVRRDVKEMETRLQQEIELLRRDVEISLKEMKTRITLRLGGLVVAGVTVLGAMIGVVIARIQV